MSTKRKADPRPAPPRPRLAEGHTFRLHATTALSRILRGQAEDVPELLAILDPADLATLRSAARLLATLADSAAQGEAESGAA
jgi:hypothetical protein